jgi:hypothetical protein
MNLCIELKPVKLETTTTPIHIAQGGVIVTRIASDDSDLQSGKRSF